MKKCSNPYSTNQKSKKRRRRKQKTFLENKTTEPSSELSHFKYFNKKMMKNMMLSC